MDGDAWAVHPLRAAIEPLIVVGRDEGRADGIEIFVNRSTVAFSESRHQQGFVVRQDPCLLANVAGYRDFLAGVERVKLPELGEGQVLVGRKLLEETIGEFNP